MRHLWQRQTHGYGERGAEKRRTRKEGEVEMVMVRFLVIVSEVELVTTICVCVGERKEKSGTLDVLSF